MAAGHLRSSCRFLLQPNGPDRVRRGVGTPSRPPHSTSPTKKTRMTFTSPLRASRRFGIMGLTSPLGARWLIADGRDPFKVHPAHPPPAQRRQPSFLSPSTSSSSLCHCAVRGRAQLDARATFPSTPAIKESLHILEEGLWPHAGAVASGSGPDNRTFFACTTVIRGPVRQILFCVKSVYTDKSSTSGRSMGWGETLWEALERLPGAPGTRSTGYNSRQVLAELASYKSRRATCQVATSRQAACSARQ